MFGYAKLACFILVGRPGDLCRLRSNPGYLEVRNTHLRVFFDTGSRKNGYYYAGNRVDIATADTG